MWRCFSVWRCCSALEVWLSEMNGKDWTERELISRVSHSSWAKNFNHPWASGGLKWADALSSRCIIKQRLVIFHTPIQQSSERGGHRFATQLLMVSAVSLQSFHIETQTQACFHMSRSELAWTLCALFFRIWLCLSSLLSDLSLPSMHRECNLSITYGESGKNGRWCNFKSKNLATNEIWCQVKRIRRENALSVPCK